MRKTGVKIISVSAIFFMAFFGCQKIEDHKIPPSIQLKGSNPMTLKRGCEFNDPGVVVTDDVDSEGTITVNKKFDTIWKQYGEYEVNVNYTATDSDGNNAFAQRKLIFLNRSSTEYKGTYDVTDTLVSRHGNFIDTSRYMTEVIILSVYPQLLAIMNFNNFDTTFKTYLTHDSAGAIQINFDLHDTLIWGTGTSNCDSAGFSLDYKVKIQQDTTHHKAAYFFKKSN